MNKNEDEIKGSKGVTPPPQPDNNFFIEVGGVWPIEADGHPLQQELDQEEVRQRDLRNGMMWGPINEIGPPKRTEPVAPPPPPEFQPYRTVWSDHMANTLEDRINELKKKSLGGMWTSDSTTTTKTRRTTSKNPKNVPTPSTNTSPFRNYNPTEKDQLLVMMKRDLSTVMTSRDHYVNFMYKYGISMNNLPSFHDVDAVEINQNNELIVSEKAREISDQEPVDQ